MAEVFLGSSLGAEGFRRRVAIKRVLPELSDNPEFAQMFIKEAQISSRLVHPNIVSVIDFHKDANNRLFLVMELVEGCDLDALLTSGPLPYPVIIFIATEVLRGLGHAHNLTIGPGTRGLIHRDVSPHNVLLSWEGAVKISDFGIAKARTASAATASAFIRGKPAYMSPEQARGEPLDGRSDLFAAGVMLWEMLVDKRLFVAADTQATLAALLFGPIARPRLLRSTVAKDLEQVTLQLLERDPARRYPTAEAAIFDLLQCEDAPTAGREMLRQILAERFPGDAPQRPSARRMMLGSSAAQPIVETTAASPRRNRPSLSAPDLSSVMSAPTGTVHAAKPSGTRATVVLTLALALLGLALLGFAVLGS